MPRILLLAVLICVWFAPSSAEACRRCRRSGRSCAYYGTAYYEPYYKSSYAPKVVYRDRVKYRDRDVFVIQNNGSNYEPLVGQGATQYQSTGGYQAAVLPFFDPNDYVSSQMELVKAVERSQVSSSERTNALVERIVELQAPAVEKLASGQAASLVLRAAGLDPAHNTRGGSQAVVVSHNDEGHIQVTPLSSDQLLRISERTETQITTDRTTIGRPQEPSQNGLQNGSLLKQYCISCHGVGQEQPGGGLYLGDDEQTIRDMREALPEIYAAVHSGRMPKASAPQPSDEERQLILDEIVTLITSQPSVTKEE